MEGNVPMKPSNSTPHRVLIIGAGPTALGALHRLFQLKREQLINENVEVLVLEQEWEVGGLARSVTDDNGFCWDLGVHVMGISKYKDFTDALASCVPEWRVVPRRAMADMSHVMEQQRGPEQANDSNGSIRVSPVDCYVPYPVQNSLPYFPEHLKQQCLAELAQLRGNKPKTAGLDHQQQRQQDSFDSFSLALFGQTLQRIFIRPYNEKVWTVSLAEMGTRWLRGRVPLIDWAQLERRCGLSRAELLAEDCSRQTAFRYPAGCRGVGQMWAKFAAANFPDNIFLLGHRVVGIDPEAKLVRSLVKRGQTEGDDDDDRGRKVEEEEKVWPYDVLISTMPLTELGRLSGLAPQLALKWSTVILVGIGLHGGQSQFARQLSWAYYPRPEIVFYRCTVLSNFSPELVPQPGPSLSSSSSSCSSTSNQQTSSPFWSVLCEIGQSADAEMPTSAEQRAALVKRVIQDLIRVGVLRASTDVCSSWLKCLPFGYPIPSRDRDQVLAQCHDQLEGHRIYSRGRFGGWRYEVSNQDHSFLCGLELVDRLFLGIPESLYTSD